MCFLSVINFGAFLAIMTPNISSVPFALSSSGIPITHALYLLKLSHSSQMFCSFFKIIFSLAFEFEEFPLIHHGPHRFLHQLCHIYSWNHSRHPSLLLQCFFISSISFWFVFSVSVSQLTLPICSHSLSVFFPLALFPYYPWLYWIHQLMIPMLHARVWSSRICFSCFGCVL